LTLHGHRAREWKQANPEKRLAALFNSDGQAWIQHLAAGPGTAGPFAQDGWGALERLASVVDKVILAWKFAHCKDKESYRLG
jgi:hypothetical protein